MDRGNDVFRTLRWGLRKYAWVIVLCTVAVGVVLPLLQAQQDDVYEAKATVQYRGELLVPSVDVFPRVAQTVFNSGPVAANVRDTLGLNDGAAVIPQRVELVDEQDNLLFTIIGRDGSPETAQKLADNAAAIFAQQMSSTPLAEGGFTQLTPTELPARPVASLTDGKLALVTALVAGAIAGVGVVVLLLMWRQPVLDAATAEQALGAPVLGRVRLPHRRRAIGRGDAIGIAALARRLPVGRTDLILLTSPPKAATERQRLSSELAHVLDRLRAVRLLRGGELDLSEWDDATASPHSSKKRRSPRADRELVIVDGPTREEQAARPDDAVMLLVVPEGVRLALLRQAAEEHLAGELTGFVLVRRDRPRRNQDRETVAADTRPGNPEADNQDSFFDGMPVDDTRSESAAWDDRSRSSVR